MKYALEIRLTLDTADEQTAQERAEKIMAALYAEDVRRQFGEVVTEEVYTFHG
jgi:hypothetical protein